MPVREYNEKVTTFLGNLKFYWKFYNGKKIEAPKFEYPILFGIEMEYEVGETPCDMEDRLYRAQIADRLDHTYKHFAIAKRDGSLNNGFEVVSVPMSFDAHTEQWKPFFKEAADNGLVVHANCAMHVHVSRELLSPLQIGKILALIYCKDNEPFLKQFCQRAKMVYLGNKKYKEGIGADKKISDVNRHVDRYAAVNLSGAETIEFRIFKSTLDLDLMLRNLEFCDALVRFAWPSNVSIRDIKESGLKHFFNFVLENRKSYPRLAVYLKDNGYISWKINKAPMQYRPKPIAPIAPRIKRVKKASIVCNKLKKVKRVKRLAPLVNWGGDW